MPSRKKKPDKIMEMTLESHIMPYVISLYALIVFGTPAYVILYPPSHMLCIKSVILFFVKMFGLEIAMHRYFSHNAFSTDSNFMNSFLGLWAVFTGQRDPCSWCSHHRQHHRWCDTKYDYINMKFTGKEEGSFFQKFIHLHFGWFWNGIPEVNWDEVEKQPWYRQNPKFFIFLYHYPLTVRFSIEVVVLLWTKDLVYGFLIPMAFSWNVTMFVNSFVHLIGDKPFERDVYGNPCDARNAWMLGFIMVGAHNHANHHRFPHLAHTSLKWYEYDPSYSIIKCFEMLGLVKNVNRFLVSKRKKLSNNKAAGNLSQ